MINPKKFEKTVICCSSQEIIVKEDAIAFLANNQIVENPDTPC